ncbi:MAG: hypothetical protein DME65_14000 [Verrucomicrobia bacterium]|nr:MAG: hypothetical protein DME65_14000 [Verrucomicrobiota bacterium]
MYAGGMSYFSNGSFWRGFHLAASWAEAVESAIKSVKEIKRETEIVEHFISVVSLGTEGLLPHALLAFWGARQLVCSRRQLVEDNPGLCKKEMSCELRETSVASPQGNSRQAAEKDALAACAPQNSSRVFPNR